MFASARRRSRSPAQQITIPLGAAPRQIERPRAPIAEVGPALGRGVQGQSTTGTSPRRRCASTPTPISSAPAASRAILVTGSDGHVLIDGGTEKGAEVIAANIRALGFKLKRRPLPPPQPRASRPCRRHRAAAAADRRDAGRLGPRRARCSPAAPPAADDPQAGMHKPLRRRRRVGRVIADGGTVRARQPHAHRDATPGHTAGRAQLALGKLRRRGVPDDGLCRQPEPGQPRRLPLLRPPGLSRRLSRQRSPRSPPAAAKSCSPRTPRRARCSERMIGASSRCSTPRAAATYAAAQTQGARRAAGQGSGEVSWRVTLHCTPRRGRGAARQRRPVPVRRRRRR